MPDASVRANAQSTPIDRRAALGGLASAAAVLVLPTVAAAAGAVLAPVPAAVDLDAKIFEIAARAKALDPLISAAVAAADAAEARLAKQPVPSALLATDRDQILILPITTKAGEPLLPSEISAVRETLGIMEESFQITASADHRHPQLRETMARAAEIDEAASFYHERLDEIARVAGLTEAEAECKRLDAERSRICEILSTTPAQTEPGALAKFAGVAAMIVRSQMLNSGEPPMLGSCEYVVHTAAVDLLALRAREAKG